jgi:hypothetical protein
MGDGTRIGAGAERRQTASRPKYPKMHQSR